jgi:hypothetical protein
MTGQISPAAVIVTWSQYVFNISVSVQNPAKCEVCAVIEFLPVKEETVVMIMMKLGVEGHLLSLMKLSKNS